MIKEHLFMSFRDKKRWNFVYMDDIDIVRNVVVNHNKLKMEDAKVLGRFFFNYFSGTYPFRML